MTDAIKLSPRMQAIADIADGRVAADIGCDHAFVSIYLVLKKDFEKSIAMDVRSGPLEIAKRNVCLYGVEDKVDIRLSDGFEKLFPKEADTAIIAGMGGGLIVEILKRGKQHTDNDIKLILQPQSEPERVRKYLYDLNYVIINEKMLIDDGKYYVVIKAVSYHTYHNEIKREIYDNNIFIYKDDTKPYSDAELLYGRVLINNKDKILKQYLILQDEKKRRLIDSLKKAGTDNALNKIRELKYETECIREAMDTMSD